MIGDIEVKEVGKKGSLLYTLDHKNGRDCVIRIPIRWDLDGNPMIIFNCDDQNILFRVLQGIKPFLKLLRQDRVQLGMTFPATSSKAINSAMELV